MDSLQVRIVNNSELELSSFLLNMYFHCFTIHIMKANILILGRKYRFKIVAVYRGQVLVSGRASSRKLLDGEFGEEETTQRPGILY